MQPQTPLSLVVYANSFIIITAVVAVIYLRWTGTALDFSKNSLLVVTVIQFRWPNLNLPMLRFEFRRQTFYCAYLRFPVILGKSDRQFPV